MEKDLVCSICGNPTRVYMGNARKDRLCGKHADQLKKGEIFLNDAGEYIETSTNSVLTNNNISKEKPIETIKTKEDKEEPLATGKCLACGLPTKNGFFFCGKCYGKYKKKELLVKFKNCTEIEILDESYEGHFTCKDGHIVKSKSERDIDDYLFENKISHAYEAAFIPDYDTDIVLNPDFTLPNFAGDGKDVYLEHWGYTEDNIDYQKTKKYKIGIYEKAGITLICTNEKDMLNYRIALKKKLGKFEVDKINYND